RLLGCAFVGCDRAQQGKLARLERKRREDLAEALRDRVARGRQRETHRSKRRLRRRRGGGGGRGSGGGAQRPSLVAVHTKIITNAKDFTRNHSLWNLLPRRRGPATRSPPGATWDTAHHASASHPD